MTSIPPRLLMLASVLAATACGSGATAARAFRPALPVSTSATTWVAPVPTAHAEPYHLVVGPDGSVWFTELQGNRIGRVAPGGAISENALTDPGSKPHGPA